MADSKRLDSSGPDTVAFDLEVRDTAYFLWEQAGRPEGRADEYWQQALEQHIRARAYQIWLREGRPNDRDTEIWERAREESQSGSDE